MDCKGLLFRVTNSQYYDVKTSSITFKQSARLLKRKACNCEHCYFVRKELLPTEEFNYLYSVFNKDMSEGIYELRVELESDGFDSCYINDYNWIKK